MSATRSGLFARTTTGLVVGLALATGPVTTALGATPDPSTTTTTPSTATTPAPTTTTTPSASPSSTPSAATTSPAPSTSAPGAPDTLAPAAPLLAPGDPEALAAADFIARTLAEFGDHYVYPDASGGLDPANYPDYGNTIDGILALAATGSQPAQLQATLEDLTAHVGDYTGAAWGELYVGSTAKSVIGLVAGGRDPRAVGGADLVADLRGLETAAGRFSDAAAGDYTITITQALAVLALARAGEPVSSRSVQFLLDQQCADGGFRSDLGGTSCTTDPDATAFAAQALLAVSGALVCWGDVEGTRSGAAAGAAAALDLLASRQGADGSVASSDGIPNANTTAVSAQAFLAGGRPAAAASAARFLASLQYGAGAPPALAGGIAFSDATRSTTTPTDSDLRATSQSALALAGGSLLDVLAPGAEAPLPPEVCPAEPSWSTSPPATTSAPPVPTSTGPATAGATAGSGAAPSTPARAPAPASGTGSLAQTGSDLVVLVLAGLTLLVIGAAAVWGSRRRGAHA